MYSKILIQDIRYGYIIREKSEVKETLRHALAHAKNLGHSIKEFVSDNGGEFDKEEIRSILWKEGISQRLTAHYTPQQNGGCEQEMHSIVEMARTYSNREANFLSAIWAELVRTGLHTYILNRTGKSSIEGTNPYELWIGRRPRLKHMRIIGCTCCVHIPSERRKKMDKKATKRYLVGYDSNEWYRVWYTVILSRDISFQEKPNSCEEHVQLQLKNEKHGLFIDPSNQGKNREQEAFKPEDEPEQESDNTNNESEIENDSEELQTTIDKELRNCSKLRIMS